MELMQLEVFPVTPYEIDQKSDEKYSCKYPVSCSYIFHINFEKSFGKDTGNLVQNPICSKELYL